MVYESMEKEEPVLVVPFRLLWFVLKPDTILGEFLKNKIATFLNHFVWIRETIVSFSKCNFNKHKRKLISYVISGCIHSNVILNLKFFTYNKFWFHFPCGKSFSKLLNQNQKKIVHHWELTSRPSNYKLLYHLDHDVLE